MDFLDASMVEHFEVEGPPHRKGLVYWDTAGNEGFARWVAFDFEKGVHM